MRWQICVGAEAVRVGVVLSVAPGKTRRKLSQNCRLWGFKCLFVYTESNNCCISEDGHAVNYTSGRNEVKWKEYEIDSVKSLIWITLCKPSLCFQSGSKMLLIWPGCDWWHHAGTEQPTKCANFTEPHLSHILWCKLKAWQCESSMTEFPHRAAAASDRVCIRWV